MPPSTKMLYPLGGFFFFIMVDNMKHFEVIYYGYSIEKTESSDLGNKDSKVTNTSKLEIHPHSILQTGLSSQLAEAVTHSSV